MINETIQILEDLILAIKEGNLNRFDDLTYDTEGAYCSGQGLAVIADLEGTRNILEQRKQLKEETNMDEIKDVKLAWANGETVQYFCPIDDGWKDWSNDDNLNTDWHKDWRVKPKTITIGTMEVPAPATTPLKYGTQYWIPGPLRKDFCTETVWTDDKWDELAIKHGMIHLSKENAIAHAKALVLVSGGKLGESDD